MAATKTSQNNPQTKTGNPLLDITAWAITLYEDRRSVLYAAAAGLVVLVLAVAGYVVYMEQRAAEADQELGRILPVYERGDYRTALDGVDALDSTSPRASQPGQAEARAGLLEIADEYGRTNAGNLAAYYAGNAYFNLGEYDAALEMYQSFDKDENFIGASAHAAEAAIYESRGEYAQAAQKYLDAADQYESELRTPRYLLDAAQAYESAGQLSRARDLYDQITDAYADSPAAGEAEVFLARLQVREATGS